VFMMNATNQLQQNIILGLGGSKPGLAIYDTKSRSLKRILSLLAGQSVYAADLSPDGRVIIGGTKDGAIYRLAHQPDAGDHNYQTQWCPNCVAAPVLSVCFVDEQIFAASDTAGRVLLWLPGKAGPDRLPTGGRIICAMFRLDNRHLVGLSTSNQLLIWDWAEGDIVKIVEVPGPPEQLTALVKPVYWSRADQWVWPGRGGVIVFYSWSRNEVRSISAHTGDVYAVLVCDDELLTIGRTDESVRHWCTGTDEPVGSCEAPVGVISAALWCQQSKLLLLINDLGKAGVYSWTNGDLKFLEQLSGEHYRIAVGPDMQKVESALCLQKATYARELSVQIKEKIARRQTGSEVDSHHQQLVQLGYEHVSLALRAEEYRINNEIVSELQCYKKLTELVPETNEKTKGSLLRYATLLESLWQHEVACSVYTQLAQRYLDNNDYAEHMCGASKYISIFNEDGTYVIETDVPLSLLVKAAMVLDKKFTGRYLLKKIGTPVNCDVIISTGEFIEKYNQIAKTKPQELLPQAEQTELWWLSNNKTEQTTTVILASNDSGPFSCLESAIKFLDAHLQTVLVPVVMFNANRKTNNDVPIEQHNQAILEMLQRIHDDSSFTGWLKVVYGNIRETIRQLITRKLAERNR
jgi:WD40 repeat protein